MLIPYSTDAPVYYWPYGTLGLILANVMLFLGVDPAHMAPGGPWILQFGAWIRPDQWLGSMFSHAGIGHLLANMLFLWVFGLVVEGKLGMAKFLACYLGIGVTQAALLQLAMLGYTGPSPGALGASSAIYGLIAMAAVWAPANNISFLYWLTFIHRGVGDLPISLVAGFYIGVDFLITLLQGGSMSSSVLHLSGAAIGFPLGVVLLKQGVVDCEGWDLFSRANLRLKGEKELEQERVKEEQREAERRERSDSLIGERVIEAQKAIREYLEQGNAVAALTLYRKMSGVGDGLVLDRAERATLVNGLLAAKRWSDAAPFMVEIIEESPERSDPVRLKLAHLCVVELGRPGRAVDLMRDIDSRGLDESQQALAQKLLAKARRMRLDGHVELDDDKW